MSSHNMDIVDRLNIALTEMSVERDRLYGLHEYTTELLPTLLMEARDEIHRLQGVSYSYPPSHGNHGVTWREEYESLRESFVTMPVADFLLWKSIMRDE